MNTAVLRNTPLCLDVWNDDAASVHVLIACHHEPQMGGNSLQAGALCSQLCSALGMEQAIPLVWVLQCQTIEALAARLADAGAVRSLAVLPPLEATISAQQRRHP